MEGNNAKNSEELTICNEENKVARNDFFPIGMEYKRAPTPPASVHSSVEDLDGNNNDRKKKTQVDWLAERNAHVKGYLESVAFKPKFKLETSKPDANHEVFIYDSQNRDAFDQDLEEAYPVALLALEKIMADEDSFRSNLLLRLTEGNMTFHYDRLHQIMHSTWAALRLKRTEELLVGNTLTIIEPLPWILVYKELQMIYGPLDLATKRFVKMADELKRHKSEVLLGMFDYELELLRKIMQMKLLPSNCARMIEECQTPRRLLEDGLAPLQKINLNPFSAEECLDFWVLPRPKTEVSAYEIRATEKDLLLEFKYENKFVRKGYNATIFDVGFYYYPYYVHAEIPPEIPLFESDTTTELLKDTNTIFLNIRKWFRVNCDPWGAELKYFVNTFRLDQPDGQPALKLNEAALQLLPDLFYCQKLGDRTILFDGLLEGQLDSPKNILRRLWAQVRILIELQPQQQLAVNDMNAKYEQFLKQRFYAKQWGFESSSEFVKYCCFEMFADDPASMNLKLTLDNNNEATTLQVIQWEGDPWENFMSQHGPCTEEELEAAESLSEEFWS